MENNTYTFSKKKKKKSALAIALFSIFIVLGVVAIFLLIQEYYGIYTDWKDKLKYSNIETYNEYSLLYLNGNIENISNSKIKRVDIVFEFYKRATSGNNEEDRLQIKKQVYYLDPGEIKSFSFSLNNSEKAKLLRLGDYGIRIIEIKYKK